MNPELYIPGKGSPGGLCPQPRRLLFPEVLVCQALPPTLAAFLNVDRFSKRNFAAFTLAHGLLLMSLWFL